MLRVIIDIRHFLATMAACGWSPLKTNTSINTAIRKALFRIVLSHSPHPWIGIDWKTYHSFENKTIYNSNSRGFPTPRRRCSHGNFSRVHNIDCVTAGWEFYHDNVFILVFADYTMIWPLLINSAICKRPADKSSSAQTRKLPL